MGWGLGGGSLLPAGVRVIPTSTGRAAMGIELCNHDGDVIGRAKAEMRERLRATIRAALDNDPAVKAFRSTGRRADAADAAVEVAEAKLAELQTEKNRLEASLSDDAEDFDQVVEKIASLAPRLIAAETALAGRRSVAERLNTECDRQRTLAEDAARRAGSAALSGIVSTGHKRRLAAADKLLNAGGALLDELASATVDAMADEADPGRPGWSAAKDTEQLAVGLLLS